MELVHQVYQSALCVCVGGGDRVVGMHVGVAWKQSLTTYLNGNVSIAMVLN